MNKISNSQTIKTFAKNMKKIRKSLGITQEELGFRSELHKNYISDTECGSRNISLLAVEKIAKGLDTPISELFRISDDN